jgi:thioredoxin-like negative regulator of GroEL
VNGAALLLNSYKTWLNEHGQDSAFAASATVDAEKLGEPAYAAALYRWAVELAPGTEDLCLELARLFVNLGGKKKAQTKLLPLSELGGTFSRQNEVQKLLQDAGG